MNESRIALVTGGNKGIGYEICRQLMHRGCHVLLGARNRSEGEAAVAALTKEDIMLTSQRVKKIKKGGK